jgi:hypothetical protein
MNRSRHYAPTVPDDAAKRRLGRAYADRSISMATLEKRFRLTRKRIHQIAADEGWQPGETMEAVTQGVAA